MISNGVFKIGDVVVWTINEYSFEGGVTDVSKSWVRARFPDQGMPGGVSNWRFLGPDGWKGLRVTIPFEERVHVKRAFAPPPPNAPTEKEHKRAVLNVGAWLEGRRL